MLAATNFETVRTQIFIQLTILLLGLLLTGCDPYYSISVTNKTTDTVTIQVKPTINFRTEKSKTSTTSDGYDVYKLTPTEIVQVGSAIAEIDNDISFNAVRIIKRNDTISASNLDDIKNLFDKKTFGGLQTPYNLSIK